MLRKYAGERSGNVQETLRKRSRNVQETPGKCSGNTQDMLLFRKHRGNARQKRKQGDVKAQKKPKKKKTESSPPLLNKKHDTLPSAGDARKFKTSAQNARTRLTETNSVKSPQFRTRWTNFRPGGFKIFAKAPRWLITNTSLALKHYEVALSDSRSKLRRSRFLTRGLSYAGRAF